MPHDEALSLLEKAVKQKELFVFHKGTPVKLNVAAIPTTNRKSVEDALTKKLKQMDCPIQADAAVELVASTEGPKQKTIAYMHSGEYKVQEYCTRLKFMYQGKPIWETSNTNIPYFLRLGEGENIEGVLRKASKQPAYAFYDHVVLPEFLQKPSTDQQRPGSGQTLGACRVTASGFR